MPALPNPPPKPERSRLSDLRAEGAPYAQGRHPGRSHRSILADRNSCRPQSGQRTTRRAPLAGRQRRARRPCGHACVGSLAGNRADHLVLRLLRRPMVSAGYAGLEARPGSGFFVCCMVCCSEPQAHERSLSLGRLLGRAAAVGAIVERSERMGSSTKEARCLTRISVKIKACDNKSTTAGTAAIINNRLGAPSLAQDAHVHAALGYLMAPTISGRLADRVGFATCLLRLPRPPSWCCLSDVEITSTGSTSGANVRLDATHATSHAPGAWDVPRWA
jgi:hypothetical protein